MFNLSCQAKTFTLNNEAANVSLHQIKIYLEKNYNHSFFTSDKFI